MRSFSALVGTAACTALPLFQERSVGVIEVPCVVCVEGCQGLAPLCDGELVQVFAAPGLVPESTCAQQAVQPWSGITEWCCPARPAACVAAVADPAHPTRPLRTAI